MFQLNSIELTTVCEIIYSNKITKISSNKKVINRFWWRQESFKSLKIINKKEWLQERKRSVESLPKVKITFNGEREGEHNNEREAKN